MNSATENSAKKILLVGVNWVGDTLFLTPALRAVRSHFPDAHILCLVPKRVEGLLKRNPYLNGVMTYNDRASVLSVGFWRTVFELRRRRFDLAILFHGSKTKARLAKWAGIPERWGPSGKAGEPLLTRMASVPLPGVHRAQIYLDGLASFGIRESGRAIDFVPDPAAEESREEILTESGIGPGRSFAAVHPGGNWDLKRWPAEHFRSWLTLFLKANESASVVFCGTLSEEGLAQEIASGFPQERVKILAGKTSLDELAFLFRKASFVLSNDSGPIHLAASQGARIVGLYGPTSPNQTGPWSDAPMRILWGDSGCEIPCYFRSCDNRICMEQLSAQQVLEACQQVSAER